jgi:3',5'-cyclic AMP phosphodiesterase CpdA
VDQERYRLLARFVHISDAQIVDEESPGRLAFVAGLSGSAWRRQEAYSVHLLDGMIRTVNKIHEAQRRIDFLIHTGDACDNAQYNELQWFVKTFDGGEIDPLTGPDDRTPNQKPPPFLDPHRPFVAQGLYQQGVHGEAPTIPWYTVVGNHDRYGLGVFPIIEDAFDVLIAPLPLDDSRIGFFAPKYLDPIGRLSWALITPALPGPPVGLTIPRFIEPNPDRRYFTPTEFVRAHLESLTQPPGHGFDAAAPNQTWYSAAPVDGLRLIVLNSSTPMFEIPTLAYQEGAISREQRSFLESELEKAQEAGEIVIVATHHPSGSLEPAYGTALAPASFRDILNQYPNVKLHVAGHWHSDAVIDRGGYKEFVTGSIIDSPQRGRIIEIWRAGTAEADEFDVQVRYWSFSHLENIRPRDKNDVDLFVDELMPLRREAAEFAGVQPPDPRTR